MQCSVFTGLAKKLQHIYHLKQPLTCGCLFIGLQHRNNPRYNRGNQNALVKMGTASKSYAEKDIEKKKSSK